MIAGTYTAYSGKGIRSELLKTRDFRSIELVPMTGDAARNKGMALFPKRSAASTCGRPRWAEHVPARIGRHHPLAGRPTADGAPI